MSAINNKNCRIKLSQMIQVKSNLLKLMCIFIDICINHNSRDASFGVSSVKNFYLHENVIYEQMFFRNEKYEY